MKKEITLLIDILFVILPNIGYIHQLMKIIKLKKSKGFSKIISFILISSYILRIFFWLGKRFANAVLFNAILGIIVQLNLLYVLVKYSEKNENNNLFAINEFWNWNFYFDYILFISLFIVIFSLLSNIFGYDNKEYIFGIGTASALIEATLDLPQIMELCKTKDSNTISYLLVFSWFIGDISKLSYYIFRQQPIQLIGCTMFQLTTDILVISQIIYYSLHKKSKTNDK